MSVNVEPSDGEDEVISAINTTPLVDVMLVLLIIFLITVPVVVKTVPINLPRETNEPTVTKPGNIVLAINKDGDIFWNEVYVQSASTLLAKLKVQAVKIPQPEVHIRGDQDARYEFIGKVILTCQRAGIVKVGFITDPAVNVK